jgi:ATP-dependent DNA helicase RecG
MREIIETVGSFANTRGGTVLIGITNAGDVHGVVVGKDTLEALTNTIHQQTDPKVFPSLRTAEVEGKTVLVLRVEESPIKPVLVQGRGWKRVGRSNHVLSSSELTRLFLESGQVSWDAGPVPDATLTTDLDVAVLQRFLSQASQERHMALDPATPAPQTLEKLGLRVHGQLSRAAVLLFGTYPQRFVASSEVRCARFKGTEPLHFLDMKVIEGNIIDQVPAAMDFIQRHISMAAEVVPDHLARQERWEYPLDALREALVNAVCHRDYRDSGNVQVRIFDDRLEVWSPGLLPEGVTVADLSRVHNSHPRNHRIARVFFLLRYIEQWGTGTLRMRELCQDAGLPLPEFTEISNAFLVTFRKSKLTRAYLAGLGLRARQLAAVDYLKAHGRITNREYATLTGVSARTATTDLQYLVAQGLLTPVGKGRSLHYQLQHP